MCLKLKDDKIILYIYIQKYTEYKSKSKQSNSCFFYLRKDKGITNYK